MDVYNERKYRVLEGTIFIKALCPVLPSLFVWRSDTLVCVPPHDRIVYKGARSPFIDLIPTREHLLGSRVTRWAITPIA